MDQKIILQEDRQFHRETRNGTLMQKCSGVSRKKMSGAELTKKFGDRNQFLQTFNPDKQIPWTKDESRCYFGTAPTLRQLNEVYGERTAEAWIFAQIVNFSVFSGAREQATAEQAREAAKLIYADYFFLKVSEMMLFFRQLKEGKFGVQFYGTFNPIVITQALKKFMNQRGDAYYRHENGGIEL